MWGPIQTGMLDLGGNSGDGVRIVSVSGNTVGGTSAAARNVISGNGGDGVEISGSPATVNLIQGNYIGVTVDGALPLGNGSNTAGSGVKITGAVNNTIGGVAAGARNIIADNARGVEITGATAQQNFVQGNFIGTDVGGTVTDPNGIPFSGDEFGNKNEGVLISGGAHDNTIGGTVAEARNIISGNGSMFVVDGVHISGSTTTTGNLVMGNYIGTDVSGSLVRGNSGAGVFIEGAPSNTIGGTVAGSRNVISGNGRGVEIFGATASGNLVQGNFIGTNAAGTAAAGNAADRDLHQFRARYNHWRNDHRREKRNLRQCRSRPSHLRCQRLGHARPGQLHWHQRFRYGCYPERPRWRLHQRRSEQHCWWDFNIDAECDLRKQL